MQTTGNASASTGSVTAIWPIPIHVPAALEGRWEVPASVGSCPRPLVPGSVGGMKSASRQLFASRRSHFLYRMLSPRQLHVKREIAPQTLPSGGCKAWGQAVFVGFSLSSVISAETVKNEKFSEISSFLGSVTHRRSSISGTLLLVPIGRQPVISAALRAISESRSQPKRPPLDPSSSRWVRRSESGTWNSNVDRWHHSISADRSARQFPSTSQCRHRSEGDSQQNTPPSVDSTKPNRSGCSEVMANHQNPSRAEFQVSDSSR